MSGVQGLLGVLARSTIVLTLDSSLLALLTPLISALTLHIPQEVRSQEPVTITWDTAATDPCVVLVTRKNLDIESLLL